MSTDFTPGVKLQLLRQRLVSPQGFFQFLQVFHHVCSLPCLSGFFITISSGRPWRWLHPPQHSGRYSFDCGRYWAEFRANNVEVILPHIPLIHNCAEDVLGSHGIELANSIISIFLVSTSTYWNVRQPDEAAQQYSRRKTWG